MADALPPCGLYRTTTAHPDRAEQVPAGRLVYFHNHSNQDLPLILLPKDNTANQWTFQDRGYLVKTVAWCASLAPLKTEGFYRLSAPFQTGGQIVPEGQIVQLGYNRDAEPVIFFPRYEGANNALVFPTKGMKVNADVYALLTPVDVRGPVTPGTPAPRPA